MNTPVMMLARNKTFMGNAQKTDFTKPNRKAIRLGDTRQSPENKILSSKQINIVPISKKPTATTKRNYMKNMRNKFNT